MRTGLRRLGRMVAERADNVFARVTRPRVSGPVQRIDVLAIYREPGLLAAAVDELGASRHDVSFRLGAMGSRAPELSDATFAEGLTAGKFQNLNELLRDDPATRPAWLVLLDDDVALPAQFLDSMIEICRRLDFAVAQPAQTRFSHANWKVAKRRLFSVARQTEFVEIGPVTILRADAVELLTPFPADLRYGWGLDFQWSSIIEKAGLRMGVVDSLAVVHASRQVASTYSWDAAQEEGRQYLAGVEHAPTSVAMGDGLARHRWLPRAVTE